MYNIRLPIKKIAEIKLALWAVELRVQPDCPAKQVRRSARHSRIKEQFEEVVMKGNTIRTDEGCGFVGKGRPIGNAKCFESYSPKGHNTEDLKPDFPVQFVLTPRRQQSALDHFGLENTRGRDRPHWR